MGNFGDNEPLTEAEFDRLEEFLKSCKGGKAMNMERLDGFFAALIAGPDTVMPSEYYPEVFGGEMSDTCEFKSIDEANEILALMMRKWNVIASTLYKGDIHPPQIFEDENGALRGNDWADGFVRGMKMRHDAWSELMEDEKYSGSVAPMMMLYHEHDEDPELRPDPITPDKREGVFAFMAGGLMNCYEYFRIKDREDDLGVDTPESRRGSPKIGRNDPCPCGSGKKYKKCCGGATVN
jgi:uncharacterized protein